MVIMFRIQDAPALYYDESTGQYTLGDDSSENLGTLWFQRLMMKTYNIYLSNDAIRCRTNATRYGDYQSETDADSIVGQRRTLNVCILNVHQQTFITFYLTVDNSQQ